MLSYSYNTAVFASTNANEYNYIIVTENFLEVNDRANNSIGRPWLVKQSILDSMHAAAVNGSLLQLNNSACMARYANTLVSDARNVLLVTTDTNPNYTCLASSFYEIYADLPYAWLCGADWSTDPYYDNTPVCTLSTAQAGASNWTVLQHPISYCLIQETEEQCSLQFSLVIMIAVILANAMKATIMFLTWWKFRTPTLVTLGDTIASFLDNPDQTTDGICLTTRRDIGNGKGPWKNEVAKPWIAKRYFWFKAASVKRWLTCNIL